MRREQQLHFRRAVPVINQQDHPFVRLRTNNPTGCLQNLVHSGIDIRKFPSFFHGILVILRHKIQFGRKTRQACSYNNHSNQGIALQINPLRKHTAKHAESHHMGILTAGENTDKLLPLPVGHPFFLHDHRNIRQKLTELAADNTHILIGREIRNIFTLFLTDSLGNNFSCIFACVLAIVESGTDSVKSHQTKIVRVIRRGKIQIHTVGRTGDILIIFTR